MGLWGSKSAPTPPKSLTKADYTHRFSGPFYGSHWSFVSATSKEGGAAVALNAALAGSRLHFHDVTTYSDRMPRSMYDVACFFLVRVVPNAALR
jgi:hypothetical protein